MPAAAPSGTLLPVQPLILTLLLDPVATDRFDALRRAHFPPERNVLSAHVTLFHALPGEREGQIRADLGEAAHRAPFPVQVWRLRSLGRGVAYDLRSDELTRLRKALAAGWADDLTPQDRAWHAPHVTVQNKTTPARARALLAELAEDFAPYDVQAEGLALWRYLGGPWEALGRWDFRS